MKNLIKKFKIKKSSLIMMVVTIIAYGMLPVAAFAAGSGASSINAFFGKAIDVLKTLVIALGAGFAAWGGINLLEGYGGDNPQSNAHVR